jgi:hypothetical protein
VPDLETELHRLGLTPVPDAPRERTWNLIQEEIAVNAVLRTTINVHTRGSVPEVSVTYFGHRQTGDPFVSVQIGDVSFFLDDLKDAQILGLAIQSAALTPREEV